MLWKKDAIALACHGMREVLKLSTDMGAGICDICLATKDNE